MLKVARRCGFDANMFGPGVVRNDSQFNIIIYNTINGPILNVSLHLKSDIMVDETVNADQLEALIRECKTAIRNKINEI